MADKEKVREWLESRGLTPETCADWRVSAAYVPVEGQKQLCVRFNYYRQGQLTNFKARAIAEKKFSQMKGGKASFYNLEAVLDGPQDVVYVTEGEADALSLSEAGIARHSILSVPNGAPDHEIENIDDSVKFAFALEAISQGLCAKKYVLCCDNDEPGRWLRQALAMVLGKARCWYVDWPAGIKDANDALLAWGRADLLQYVQEEPRPWPIKGLYTLDQIPEPPELELWNPGFPEWESKIRIAPTMLSVITGKPQHGKSHFAHQLWHQISSNHDVRLAVFSAETPTLPHVRRWHRQFYAGKLEKDMDDEEIVWADNWIRDHLIFMQHPNARPRFDWLVETIEAAGHRYGCRAAIIDPWNKLESGFDNRRYSETQWIGDCLDQLLDAARSLNMHIMVVAHPAKPDHQTRNGAPDLYSISGSQHWNNRVDQGFTMHRPTILDEEGNLQTEAVFYHRKVRFNELGYPCKLNLDLDLKTGAYVSTDYRTF